VLGLVGVSLSLAGGASAAPAPALDTPSKNLVPMPGQEVILGEEEISDVSLGTFFVFDKEVDKPGVQYARGCGGCRGCRGCGGCGCRACRACGGCGGCSCGCCISWGACRFLC
jgi:hypothetical protein